MGSLNKMCCAVLSQSVISDSAIPWTVAHQTPQFVRFPRHEHWSGLPFPPPGDLLDPGIKPVSPALAGRFLTIEPPGKSGELFVVVVQLLSYVLFFTAPRMAACQAPLSSTVLQSSLKFLYIELVMPSSSLVLRRPLLLLPSVFPSVRVFSNESALHIRWPKYWSFSFIISPSNEYSGLISFGIDWFDLFAVQGTPKSLLQHHSSKASILFTQLSL